MDREWLFRWLMAETGHILSHVPPHSDVGSAESCHGLHVLCVADIFGGQQDAWSSHVTLANEM